MSAFLRKEAEKLKKESSDQGKLFAEDVARHRALVQACRVIFNLNEFVYAD